MIFKFKHSAGPVFRLKNQISSELTFHERDLHIHDIVKMFSPTLPLVLSFVAFASAFGSSSSELDCSFFASAF